MSHRGGSLLVVLAGFWLATGCAVQTTQFYTPEEASAEFDKRVSAELRPQVVVPYEIDDEIRQVAQEITLNHYDERAKARAIINKIIDLTGLSISYDWLSNKTAREVFRQGRGNCLAYSNLFVGMAREVGLDAVYVDVTMIERISREAEVIVNNGHITAGYMVGGQVRIIDFTRTPEREYIGYKVIDDLEAIANYYNNQGFLYGYFVENEGQDLDFDPAVKEVEMYELALEILPTFQRARNNLGVALKRRGRIEEAIEQYKMAIEVDPNFADAHSNLGAAYYALGRNEDAVREFELATKNAGSNAYFFHHLGVVQYQLKQYDEAIEQFKKAISREPSLAEARFFLAECYMKQGDKKKAIEEYQATLAVDPNYLSARAKLDALMASPAAPTPN
jgi:tetratricopeptide (TPR) repeat protein